MKMTENSKKGWMLEVNLEYPEELHEEHISCTLALEKKVIEKELMSVYQKCLMEDSKLDPPNSKELVLTVEYKKIMLSTIRTCSFISHKGCL